MFDGVLKVGELVAVKLLDHFMGSDAPEEVVAVGRVAKVTDQAVTLDWWFYEDPLKERDHNVERVTLVRAAILEVRVLEMMDAVVAG